MNNGIIYWKWKKYEQWLDEQKLITVHVPVKIFKKDNDHRRNVSDEIIRKIVDAVSELVTKKNV